MISHDSQTHRWDKHHFKQWRANFLIALLTHGLSAPYQSDHTPPDCKYRKRGSVFLIDKFIETVSHASYCGRDIAWRRTFKAMDDQQSRVKPNTMRASFIYILRGFQSQIRQDANLRCLDMHCSGTFGRKVLQRQCNINWLLLNVGAIRELYGRGQNNLTWDKYHIKSNTLILYMYLYIYV